MHLLRITHFDFDLWISRPAVHDVFAKANDIKKKDKEWYPHNLYIYNKYLNSWKFQGFGSKYEPVKPI